MMQTQPVDWLEVLQTLGPYVTAIVAILASMLTAWLTHRNWLKQYLTEKSFALREERLRLLQEIPRKLATVALLSENNLLFRALFGAATRLAQEYQDQPEGALAAGMVESFGQRLHETTEQWNQMTTDLYVLPITSRIYFGDETGQAIEAFYATMDQVMRFDSEGLVNLMYNCLSDQLTKGVNLDQFITYAHDEAGQVLQPLREGLRTRAFQVVQSMAERARSVT
jgi:hypothetical protein